MLKTIVRKYSSSKKIAIISAQISKGQVNSKYENTKYVNS